MQKPLVPLAIVAGLVAAGVAVAAWQVNRGSHAVVLASEPVIVTEPAFGDVLSSTPIRDLVSVPRQICRDVAVQQRLPERDGNAGGAVAGAVIGGLLGNQVGSGSGRRAATVAGAVAGGYAGHEIDRRHQGGRVVTTTQQQCETVNEAQERVVAWRVSYRDPEGGTAELETPEKPAARIALGERERVVGYDVTYRYGEVERTVRMPQAPGDRLPVVDGKVVIASDDPATTQR